MVSFCVKNEGDALPEKEPGEKNTACVKIVYDCALTVDSKRAHFSD